MSEAIYGESKYKIRLDIKWPWNVNLKGTIYIYIRLDFKWLWDANFKVLFRPAISKKTMVKVSVATEQ